MVCLYNDDFLKIYKKSEYKRLAVIVKNNDSAKLIATKLEKFHQNWWFLSLSTKTRILFN